MNKYIADAARYHVVSSLQVCSGHRLSRALLLSYAGTLGDIYCIHSEHHDASNRLYRSDSFFPETDNNPGLDALRLCYSPLSVMSSYCMKYLSQSESRVVAAEYFGMEKDEYPLSPYVNSSLLRFFGKDVYSILAIRDIEAPGFEDAISIKAYWQTGVMSQLSSSPIPSNLEHEEIDGIAAKAKMIFVPAYDMCGFLVCAVDREHNELVRDLIYSIS